jgi:hypothetical protein
MELFVTWCGFIGSWLLFAGPIYQAAMELREENIENEHFEAAARSIEKPPKISQWWWLLPPVKVWLERRRSHEYRRSFVSVLSPEDVEQMITFINKAAGWLLVAAGGFLIAIKETYELVEAMHWETAAFWIIIPMLALISVANTAARMARTERIIAKHKQ